jgi:putative hemolysin
MPSLVEVGRSCIHPDYRRGGVITLLWAGLARYMLTAGFEYLMGCASISLADGGDQATDTYLSLRDTCLSPAYWRVTPRHPYPVGNGLVVGQPILPPLIKLCSARRVYLRRVRVRQRVQYRRPPDAAADVEDESPLCRHVLGDACPLHVQAA